MIVNQSQEFEAFFPLTLSFFFFCHFVEASQSIQMPTWTGSLNN